MSAKVVEFPSEPSLDLSVCTEPEMRPELVVTLKTIEAAIKELGGMPERPRSIFDWPDSGDHDWGDAMSNRFFLVLRGSSPSSWLSMEVCCE